MTLEESMEMLAPLSRNRQRSFRVVRVNRQDAHNQMKQTDTEDMETDRVHHLIDLP
jgi:hypothetical protein